MIGPVRYYRTCRLLGSDRKEAVQLALAGSFWMAVEETWFAVQRLGYRVLCALGRHERTCDGQCWRCGA